MPPQVKDANVIVDLAVHDIDIFGYLLGGGEPTDLFCNAGRAIAQDRFDFAGHLPALRPVACFLQVNWVTPVKIRSLAVPAPPATPTSSTSRSGSTSTAPDLRSSPRRSPSSRR